MPRGLPYGWCAPASVADPRAGCLRGQRPVAPGPSLHRATALAQHYQGDAVAALATAVTVDHPRAPACSHFRLRLTHPEITNV